MYDDDDILTEPDVMAEAQQWAGDDYVLQAWVQAHEAIFKFHVLEIEQRRERGLITAAARRRTALAARGGHARPPGRSPRPAPERRSCGLSGPS
jgi:hypothetical protein